MIIFTTNGTLEVNDQPSREPTSIFIPPLGLPYNLPFELDQGVYIVSIDVDIYNKSTRETTTFLDVDASYTGGVITFSLDFQGTKNTQYYLIVTDSATQTNGKLLFNANAVCTDQTDLQDFSIVEGDFIRPTQSSNEFIENEQTT